MKRVLAIILCLAVAAAMAPIAERGTDRTAFAGEEEENGVLQMAVEEELESNEEPAEDAGLTEEEATAEEEAATEATDPEEPTEVHVHKYTSKVTKKATCTRAGVRTYTCACGASYTKKISKLGHKYKTKVVKKAKCTKAGKKRYRCTRCGHTYYKKIPKLGHNYKKTTLRKATCTHTGKAKYKCKRCGRKFRKKIPKKVHHPKWKNGRYVCRDCGAKIKKLVKYQKTLIARDNAVSWAKKIAKDNSFHYGEPKWAHHNGCYFCGTNQAEDSSKRKRGATLEECAKTYCCNPFVTAAYCHGAKAVEVDCTEHDMRFGLANDSNKVVRSSAWKKVSKPSKVTKLLPGDVLLTPTHAMLYAGGGKVVEAAHHDNGERGSYWNDSIRYEKISSRQWKRVKKIYRYMGIGKFQKR